MAQRLIGQDQRQHGLAHRHGANAHARIVTAFGDDFRFRAIAVDGPPGRQDGGGRLHRETRHNGLARGDAAQDAAGMVGKKHGLSLIAPAHLVGILLAAHRGSGEAVADFHAFDGIDAHQGAGDFIVELGVDRRAQAGGNAFGHHLDDGADGRALLAHALEILRPRSDCLGIGTEEGIAGGLLPVPAAAVDPFAYDDAVGKVQTAASATAARIATLNAAMRRLRAALQPVRLPTPLATASTDALGWDAVAVAEHYLGVRYRWGGSTPQSGFDCSGFVKFVYAQLGLTLAHYAATEYHTTPHINPTELEAGDLIFFEPRPDGPGHVGIYVGEGQLIEAPHTGDVVKLAPLSELTATLSLVGATRPTELLQP